MKKNLVITFGIGAAVFGAFTAYQLMVKPQATNQVEQILAEIKAEVAERDDGSEFTYGDVSIEGLSAVIQNIHYVDGGKNLVSDVEVAKISATNGHIHSAELTNWATTGSTDEMAYEASAAITIIEDLKFPSEISEHLRIGDVTFGTIALQDSKMNADLDDFSVSVTYDSAKMSDKSADLIASNTVQNMVIAIDPLGIEIKMPSAQSQNTHLPAELDVMSSAEEMLMHYAKFFSETSMFNADIYLHGAQIGATSMQSSDIKAGPSGFPISGTSKGVMSANATQAQLLEWIKLAAQSADDPSNFDEAATKAVFEKLGLDNFELAVDVYSNMTAEGGFDMQITYDLGGLGKLDINAEMDNYHNDKIYAVIGNPTKEPTEEEMLEAFGEIGLKKVDITYRDGVLADFLMDIDPNIQREQMAIMSQIMVPSLLPTEPTLAQPLTDAVVGFINGANGFEIHAEPNSPVTIIGLIEAFEQGQQIAPLLNVTVSGE